MVRVPYTVKVDMEIRDDFQNKFNGQAGAELERLMQIRLRCENITEASIEVAKEIAQDAEQKALLELKSRDLYQHFILNQKAYGVTAVQYLDFYAKTGKVLYAPTLVVP